ncbi:hypothetical protein HYE82_02480 [Streptomyces sp. BR123]|uniref:hypothetical protein n=1 Tax=Streptomyces sp. BR123 TaxID=2749828 RepID=UPI0015C48C9A|nr:hypothetical protein [Streptomyces sp. BR123]NXY93295.1 hypothetical protein [Streptomyces sp. BR123]
MTRVPGAARGGPPIGLRARAVPAEGTRPACDLQLPLTEPEQGNAVHGLLRWTSWQVTESDGRRAVLRTALWPQPG